MNLESFYSLVSRIFFAGALLLFAVAAVERGANWTGYTVLGGVYRPARLLEISAILLLFVAVVLLRQIRQALREPPRA